MSCWLFFSTYLKTSLDSLTFIFFVLSGGQELIDRIDKEGYHWVKELGFDFETEEDKQPIVLGSCGNKVKAK